MAALEFPEGFGLETGDFMVADGAPEIKAAGSLEEGLGAVVRALDTGDFQEGTS